MKQPWDRNMISQKSCDQNNVLANTNRWAFWHRWLVAGPTTVDGGVYCVKLARDGILPTCTCSRARGTRFIPVFTNVNVQTGFVSSNPRIVDKIPEYNFTPPDKIPEYNFTAPSSDVDTSKLIGKILAKGFNPAQTKQNVPWSSQNCDCCPN